MDEFFAFLVLVFCTPLGWIGMLVFGYMIYLIRGKR